VKIDLAQSLCSGLGISAGHLIAIAGAGGKTSLMYGLGRELAAFGDRVLLTTTTKIIYPRATEVARVMLGPETEDTMAGVKAGLDGRGPLLVGREKQEAKIIGFSPEFVDALYSHAAPVTVIAECDGAMGRSLKVPRDWEPVLPAATTVYVVVVGADCLGKRLSSGLVFQPEGVAALAGVEVDAELDTALAVRSVLAPRSYAGRKPEGARFCIFINKWDAVQARTAGDYGASAQDPAVRLAVELKKSTEVDRIVLGSVKSLGVSPMMVMS
jgi:probable selenium-dependent hydroxylase accessory protein YqeC